MDTTVTEMVCTIRERVAEKLGRQRYRTWFGETAEFRLSDDQLHVVVANPFACSWIEANYLGDVTEAARGVTGNDVRVAVRVAEAIRSGSTGNSADARPVDRDVAVARAPRATPTDAPRLRGELSTFVVGHSNSLAHAAAQAVVRNLAGDLKPLVMHGGCGLGKTHLLQGICNGVSQTHPECAWRYVSGEEFTNEFVTAVRLGRVDAFRARFRRLDLLVIDDLHFLSNKRATQDEFLHTFNAIDSRGKQIVLSTDLPPRALANMSQPLVNRLVAGMVVEIGPPDFRLRREIAARRATAMRAHVPDDVLDFVARSISSNVRELEGVLYKLAALAALNHEPISVTMARTAMADILSRSEKPSLLSEIESLVAQRFGVSREMIHSDMRGQTVALARAVAMYLVRRHTQMSFPEIGRAMGGKNHSTVLMAKRRIENLLAHNGTVEWTTSTGKVEFPLSEVLFGLEQMISRQRG